MFKIKDGTIMINRGDTGTIKLKNSTPCFYPGDVVTFYIVTAGNYTDVKLKKEHTVLAGESTTECYITLTPNDTKSICDPFKSGQLTFWYEIQLTQSTNQYTLVGAGPCGPKVFVIYPEAVEID